MLKIGGKGSGPRPGMLLSLLLLGFLLFGCSEDNQTGVWIRIVSPKVTITNARLYVYDATSFDTQWVSQVDVPEPPLVEARTFDPTSDDPSNQLWVLILAGSEVNDSIRVVGIGLRDGREVANANLDKIVFRPGRIIDHEDGEGNPLTLVLEGCEDDDQDGFCPPSDCDDGDAAVNPDVTEVCDDKDNNCDRATDEGCPCSPGDQRDCWPQWAPAKETVCFNAGSNDACACKQGTQSCAGGVWGGCDGLVMPSVEGNLDENGNPVPCDDQGSFLCYPTCSDEIDNDCNRFVDLKDTGCGGCEPGTERDCYTGPPETRRIGTCHDGRQNCKDDGTWPLDCPTEATPEGWSKETPDGAAEFDKCDNLDNDCDGITDNVTIHQPCALNSGCCREAVKDCVGGQWIDCTLADYQQFAHDTCYDPLLGDNYDYYVTDETTDNCDGLDNDCDGEPDDVFDPNTQERLCKCKIGDTAVCETRSQGICVPGLFICVDGELVMDGTCVQGESSESCDNLDNDCDGITDLTEAARLDCENNIVGTQQNARVDRCVQGECRCVCDVDWWDNDQNLCTQGGGCEYNCHQSAGGVERCDGTDNNCNGPIDAADQPLASVDALCPYRAGTKIPGRGGEAGGPADACVAGECQFECAAPYDDCDNDRRLPVPLPGENDASDGCEIDLTDDLNNCGACGNQCSFDHGGAYCQNFTCRLGACIGLWDDCNSQEADGCETSLETLTDCGGCGSGCSRAHATASCSGGSCHIASCDPGWGNCDGNDANGCENTLDSLSDCGSCGTSCSRSHASASCSGDSCHITSCDSGWDDCDGTDQNGCENSLDSLSDCGSCGTSCSRTNATASCSGDSCHIASCNSGWGNCDNNDQNGCENPLDSLTDCGSCGSSCSRTHATASCSGDSCHIASCDGGFGDCDGNDGNGCENTLDSLTNCGTCGTSCSRANATASCSGDSCHISSCNSGFDDCDNVDGNGCENSLDSLDNCGSCGTFCSRANATASCSGDTCHIASCSPGFGDCDGNDGNGCENTLDSLTDCGSCSTACNLAHASESCSGDTCHVTGCDSGWGDCDGNDGNGCENTLDSLTNCGSCGTSCSRAHATASCSGDSCHIGSCDALWDDCNSTDSDGCERSLETLSDCSSCDTTCNRANATASCSGGSCHVASCSPGWGNCDGNDGNGCENTLDSLTDCGSCGTTCSRANATASCSGDTCHISSCDPGFDNCDGLDPNGCENSLDSLADCGSCGTSCSRAHATASCSGDSCHIGSCDALWDDCNSTDSDGCETSLETLSDCSSCDTTCNRANATASCSGGSCHIGVCDAGYDNCDSDDSTGCETTLGTSSDCSACSDACGPTTNKTCISGSPNFCGCNNNGDCNTSGGETCDLPTEHLCKI